MTQSHLSAKSAPTLIAILLLAAISCPLGLAQELPDRPLTLDDCIAIALTYNPRVISSEQSIVTARANVTRTRSQRYPQLSLSAGVGYPSLGLGTFDYTSPSRLTQVALSLRTDFWRQGQKEREDQARAEQSAAELTHAFTLQELAVAVAQAYHAVLAQRELVAVAQAGVESAKAHLDQVNTRIRIGVAAEVDIHTAEDDLARAELDAISAHGALRSATAQLAFQMGLPQGTKFELAQAPPPAADQIPTPQDALRVALLNRPDVQADQAMKRARELGLDLAKLTGRPTAALTGQFEQRYTDFKTRGPAWNVRLDVDWPILDGHAADAEQEAARASLIRAQADLQQLVNQIGFEVEDVLIEVERSRESLAAAQKSVAAAEARLAAAQGKYQQGVGILLEVIDARVAVTTARANEVRAQYDYHNALVALRQTMGTLLPPQNVAQLPPEAPG